MKIVEQIYNEYKIMPNLKEHMYKVAATASLICDNFSERLDKNSILSACLLHDMGNIIKSKLDYFPEFLEPEGMEYWSIVQKDYIKKYGNDEHEATIKIAKELKIPKKIISLLKCFKFLNAYDLDKEDNWNKKICFYSDMRVSPHGIVSIEERFIDGQKRYPNLSSKEKTEKCRECIKNIEKQIFEKSKIRPEEITEDKVKNKIKSLKNFIIK